MNCFLGKERDFHSSQRARGTGVWARLVVAHRWGLHGHSRRDIHGLPARYRAVPRGPAAAQSSCPGVINQTDTKDRRKITLLDTELCTWVEGFLSFFKTPRKETGRIILGQIRKLRGLTIQETKTVAHDTTHPWIHSETRCKSVSCGEQTSLI